MEIERRRYFDVKCDLVLDERRTDRNGLKRVQVRLYNNRKYTWINTGLKAADWKSVTPDELVHVTQIYDNIWKRVITLVGENSFTPDAVKESKSCESFNDYVRDKIAVLEKENRWSTSFHYKNALDLFTKKCGTVKLSEINPRLFADFTSWMQDNNYSSTTIKIYLNDLKAVVNSLRYKKLIKEDAYPFRRCPQDTDRVALPKGNKRTDCWLDKGTIQKIWASWEESKDPLVGLWMFSYLSGGMNITDILDLRFDRHWKRTNGTEFRYRRKKTAAKNDFDVIVPVNCWLQEIIDTVGVREDERVFNYLDECKTPREEKMMTMSINNRVSSKVSKLCNSLGITDHVTTTWARHSFATVMSRERVPAAYIEAAMGHARNDVSSHYIAAFSGDEMREFSMHLL